MVSCNRLNKVQICLYQFRLNHHVNYMSNIDSFYCLLVTFANCLGPNWVQQNVGPHLETSCLTLFWYSFRRGHFGEGGGGGEYSRQ